MTITYGIGYPRSEDILKFTEMISKDLISVCDVRKILELRSHMKLNDFFSDLANTCGKRVPNTSRTFRVFFKRHIGKWSNTDL